MSFIFSTSSDSTRQFYREHVPRRSQPPGEALVTQLCFEQFAKHCVEGVVAYHQAALNKEFTSLKATEGVKLVLTLSRGGPEHNQMVSEVQIQRRYNKVAPKSGIIFCVKLTVKN